MASIASAVPASISFDENGEGLESKVFDLYSLHNLKLVIVAHITSTSYLVEVQILREKVQYGGTVRAKVSAKTKAKIKSCRTQHTSPAGALLGLVL